METVKKGKEPSAWKQYRTTPGADYKATPQLSFALLKENGFVCAYCGRRIPCNDPISDQNDEDSNHTLKYRTDKMHIEHVYPREALDSAAERMDYSNMVACCPGFIGDSGWQPGEVSCHCDHRKGSRFLHFNPFAEDLGKWFTYKTNLHSSEAGAIYTDKIISHIPGEVEKAWLDAHRKGWDKGHPGKLTVNLQTEIGPVNDLKHKDNILNLNHPFLRQNRAAVIKGIQKVAKNSGNAANKKIWWERLLKKFSTMSEIKEYPDPNTGEIKRYAAYPAYRSIAIYYISKKLRQFD